MINYFLNLKKRKYLKYIFLAPILWNLLSSITLVYLFDINLSDHKGEPDYSISTYFFMSVFFAPLYETLIYQFFTIEFFRLIFEKLHKLLLILISGFLFGFVHYFNANSYLYSFFAFIMGLFFAFIYEISKTRKDIKSHFFLVAFVHASVNVSGPIVGLIIGLLSYFFQ